MAGRQFTLEYNRAQKVNFHGVMLDVAVLSDDGGDAAYVLTDGGADALATAKQFTASGELLSALQDLLDACEFWDNQDDPVLKAARVAITKATA